jgi:hypothetical protein
VKSGECLFKLPISSGVSLTHMDVAADMSTIVVADANSTVCVSPLCSWDSMLSCY